MPLLKRTPPACPLISTHFHQMKASGRVRVEFKPICLAPRPPRPRSGKHTPTLTCTTALYIHKYVKTTTNRTVGEAYCLHLMFLALSARNMWCYIRKPVRHLHTYQIPAAFRLSGCSRKPRKRNYVKFLSCAEQEIAKWRRRCQVLTTCSCNPTKTEKLRWVTEVLRFYFSGPMQLRPASTRPDDTSHSQVSLPVKKKKRSCLESSLGKNRDKKLFPDVTSTSSWWTFGTNNMSAGWVQKNDLKMWFFGPNNVIQASQRKCGTEKSMQAVTENCSELSGVGERGSAVH